VVIPTIGAENDFKVLAIHEADTAQRFDRKINNRKIVFGAKSHTVLVPEDVSGIVAYLAAPNGTVIGENQGMLLPPCELNGENLLIRSPTPVICRFRIDVCCGGSVCGVCGVCGGRTEQMCISVRPYVDRYHTAMDLRANGGITTLNPPPSTLHPSAVTTR
jgi:hypothetical protein